MAKQPAKPPPKGDPLIARMDAFADNLLTVAQATAPEGKQELEFRDKLDAFREVARWMAVKKGFSDGGSGIGESLAEFKSRVRAEDDGKADLGTSRRFARTIRAIPKHPTGAGGPALDAIKARLPGANHGHDAGGGNGAERASIGAAGSLGELYPSGDGDD